MYCVSQEGSTRFIFLEDTFSYSAFTVDSVIRTLWGGLQTQMNLGLTQADT